MKFSDRMDHFIPPQFHVHTRASRVYVRLAVFPPPHHFFLDLPSGFDRAATMSAQCTLPTELIRPILHHIADPAPLAALCLSSKLLQSEAQRTLYRSPTQFTLRPPQHIRLLKTLVHNALLAALVKGYHVPSTMGSLKAAAWTLLRAVLPLLTNLTEFAIIVCSEEIKVLPMDRVVCQLETLAWIEVDSEPSGIFPRWLATQKALKKLKWICRSAITLPPGAVPKLVSLEGNFHVISALLPGRNIKRLHWVADLAWKGCSPKERLKGISCDLRKLESLSFESQYNAVDYHSVVEHLASLRFLELVGDHHEVRLSILNYNMAGILTLTFHVQFVDNIQIPPNLHVLMLSISHAYRKNAVLSLAQRSDFVEALFAKSPALLRVDIAAKLDGATVFYECWEQGVRREGFVSSKVMVWA
jgi:hypothetical protein